VPFLVNVAHVAVWVLTLVAVAPRASAQTVPHATVSVIPVDDPRLDRIVFDLEISRLSDHWDLWANGTFRLTNPTLDATGGIDSARFSVNYYPSSSALPIVGYNAVALDGYVIQADLANGRLNISMLSPDGYPNCVRLPVKGVALRLGRFELVRNDGAQLLGDLQWVAPEDYYQANAFKIDHDSVTGQGTQRNTWFNTDDNIPLVTSFIRRPRGDSCELLVVKDFAGQYIGDLAVRLQFTTECEVNVDGFFIERALVPAADPTAMLFEGRPNLDFANNAVLRSCVCRDGRTYADLLDGLEFRRELYAYRLCSRATGTGAVSYHDTIYVRIPSPIISNARLLQNPFQDQTTVEFNIDDRCRVSSAAYDLGGRLLARLLDANGNEILDREYAKGEKYTATFFTPEYASAGLYNIIIIATPVDKLAIEEQSRVILKAQLVR
jgi:hypothetical protein